MPACCCHFHGALYVLLPFDLAEVSVNEGRSAGFQVRGGLRRNHVDAVQVIDHFAQRLDRDHFHAVDQRRLRRIILGREDAAKVFERESTIDPQQARIAELERMVGRLTLELEVAKKASKLLRPPASRDEP